jgi:PAS domain S-box-containing protein
VFDPVASIWSMTVAACATLAAIHALVWIRDRSAHASLAFVGLAAGVAGIAVFELLMMNARTPEQFASVLRHAHLAVFVLTLSLLAMVRLIFGPSHAWIGMAAAAFRIAALAANYGTGANVNFTEISTLREIEFLGRLVSVPVGTTSAWTRLAEASNLLMLAYIVAAAVAHGRLGAEPRRPAWTIGGGLALFVVIAAGGATAVNHGLLQLPYLISLPFLGVVAVAAYEISRDLAGVRQMALALQESQQRNELATSAAGIGLFTWHAVRGEMWANSIARNMHGLADTAVSDLASVFARVHPEDREAMRGSLLDALKADPEFDVSYRAESAPGQWRWIEARGAIERAASGRVQALRGVCLDLGERRAAEERFRRVVEAAPNAMLLVDEEGRIILSNRQAELMFGCDAEALLGRSIDDFAAGIPAIAHRAHRRTYAANPEVRRMDAGRELRARRADGTEFVVEVGLSPIQSREGPQVLASIVDVTVRREHEHELQRLREQTFSAARISLAGQLASTLAHELNQPLGAILRNAEAASVMLEAGAIDATELAAILADIRSDDQRAGAIIEHMRSLLRRKRPELGAVRLDELVEKVLTLVRHDAAVRHVSLHSQVPLAIAPVLGDAVQLQQVLLNLVFNSMDALEQVPRASRHLFISARQLAEGQIELVVRDTGPGLPAESLPRIFDPFHTTKANGMGMGLAICRSLVESMQGSIDANNQIDGGAAFRIVLPRAGAAGAA